MKHSMKKTKDLMYDNCLEDICPDADMNWKLLFFKLLDAVRDDFDTKED